MKIILSLILSLAFLTACGDKIVYNEPTRDYEKCLEKYGDDKSQCEALRREYGMDQEEMPPIDDSAAEQDPGDFGPGEDPNY